MNSSMIFVAVFLPILGGILIAATPIKNRKTYIWLAEAVTILTSVLAWCLILNPPADVALLFSFGNKLDIGFRVDGFSRVFAGLVSSLWPFATLYAMEYMEEETKHSKKTFSEKSFFGIYTITFGITLGIAFGKNLLSLYVFYEMLTLVTIPLILFTLTKEALRATMLYMCVSFGGAAFAFIAFIYIFAYGNSMDFILGGVFTPEIVASIAAGQERLLRLVYIFAFFGFGVKAAVFPIHFWLPKAGVAPTPVTALLHAVAVVKAGAFAIIRIIYYSFGTWLLKDSPAQYVTMGFTIFTIVFGCSMAVKERHFKRRLAYSTVSNLSYILFAATLMTPLGMTGAMTHMIFHGIMKITAFFCAGAVITKAHKNYVYELDGFGKRMPKTFFVYTVSALALMGVPGLCGFVSKWQIANAAIEAGTVESYIGVAALLVSALLTAIYMLQVVVRAYYPGDVNVPSEKIDPSFRMLVPLFAFSIAMLFFGLYSSPLIAFFEKVAGGII